jgi:hypothetical protein
LRSVSEQSLSHISQKTTRLAAAEDENANLRVNRRLLVRAPWNGYKGSLEELVGRTYTIVFWHEPLTPIASVTVTSDRDLSYWSDDARKVTVVTVPIALANTEDGVTIHVAHETALN